MLARLLSCTQATALLVLTFIALGANAPSVEEGAYLERFRGDFAGAERIYREVLAHGAQGEVRAGALFRLGALLARRDDDEAREVMKTLFKEFPNRRDLLPRADALLRPRGPATLGPDETGSRGRVIAERPEGLFVFSLPKGVVLEPGAPCAIYRAGARVGSAIVVRLAKDLARAHLFRGSLAVGDEVDVGFQGGAAASLPPSTPDLAERARVLIESSAALPASLTVTGDAVAVDVQAIRCDISAVSSLPIVFERAPGGASSSLAPDDCACTATLTADEQRALLDRVRRSDADAASREGEAQLSYKTVHAFLRPGVRALLELAPAAGPDRASKEELSLALTLMAPRSTSSGAATERFELDVEAVELCPPPAPAILKGPEGPIAPRVSLSQHLMAAVTLTRARPHALIVGLRDPLRAGRGAQDVLLLVSLHAAEH